MPNKEDQSINATNLLKRLFYYIWKHKKLALVSLVLTIMIAIIGQSLPLLQRLAIDRYLSPNNRNLIADERINGVIIIGIFYLILIVLQFAARFAGQYGLRLLGQNVISDLRIVLFSKIQHLSLSYFDKTRVGRLVTRVTSDLEAIESFVGSAFAELGSSFFVLIISAIVIFVMDWRLALIACAVIPIMVVINQLIQKRLRIAHYEIASERAEINTMLSENLAGMATIQVFNRQEKTKNIFNMGNQRLLRAYLEAVRWFSILFPLNGFIGDIALAIIIWYGGGQVIQNALTLGTLVAFMQYLRNFWEPIRELAEFGDKIQDALVSSERIFRLLDEEETIFDQENAISIQNFRGDVEFRDVWFAYHDDPQEEDWILRGIDLKIEAGQSVALVGATGAGKTSVISLISRFYDVQRGQVLIDGIDVKNYRQKSLRRHIGVVLQEVLLFAGTIESNLRLGDETIPFAQIEEACRYVGVDEFITSLPQGYQTEVRERGATLSTGQKQLLAFARALIHNPEILLVLDEATANIDTESEIKIQKALFKLMQGRTSIIIAHRLSTIQHCDRIIVLKKGQIIEEGNHQSLIANNGYYAKLYSLYIDQESA